MNRPRVLDLREAMAHIPGGTFRMGSDIHYPEEAPARQASVGDFWIDRHTVTNREFKAFVDATGYTTVPEHAVDPALYPGANAELLVPSSVVFRRPSGPVSLRDHFNWWSYVPGADWSHPRGPGSSLQGLWDHPVVQVTFEDPRHTRNGPTRSCRPRRNGSSRLVAVWKPQPTVGAMITCLGANPWPIPGRENSHGRTSSKTDTNGPHRWVRSRRTDSVFTT